MQSTRRGASAVYRLLGDNLACSFRNQSAAFGGAQRRQCATEAKKLPPGTSEASRRLFQKVLDGQHIPPEEAAAPSKQAPTAVGRVLGLVGNLMFYGTLVGCTGFWASRYIYSLEETQQMAAAAEEAEQSLPNFFTQTYASAVCSYRDARVWLDQKMTEMTAFLRRGRPLHAALTLFEGNAPDPKCLKHELTFDRKQDKHGEPPSDMLLPDQHPLQQAHKLRTLVLDVDDVLVQSTWSRGVGWKTFKRPGASDFLDVLCRQYELVVFANRPHSYVDPILNRVDPGIVRGDGPTIAYRLYKNANSIRGNEHVRDLSKLNRDLSRTLFIVGESRAHTVLQQENVLVIPDWKSMDPADRTLLDILPLLEILSKQDVLDVRVVCQSYKDKDIVQEFRNRMEAAAAQASVAKTAQPSRSRFGF